MHIQIIGDSCTDVTPELREQLGITLVPLTLLPGDAQIVDGPDFDMHDLIVRMRAARTATRTACPSVGEYVAAMEPHEACMVITLSSHLSGSYNSARLAAEMLSERYPERHYHVFDSESASAGQLLLALLIDSLRRTGESFPEIVRKVQARVDSMHTLFVLQNLTNMVKNGRMSKIKHAFATAMSIYPVLADDGHGEIRLLHSVRGLNRAFSKLVDCIAERTEDRPPRSVQLTLCYCNCYARAQSLRDDIYARCRAVREIVLAPMAGVSTVYADDGGIVLAF